jgi:hypothetical protein
MGGSRGPWSTRGPLTLFRSPAPSRDPHLAGITAGRGKHRTGRTRTELERDLLIRRIGQLAGPGLHLPTGWPLRFAINGLRVLSLPSGLPSPLDGGAARNSARPKRAAPDTLIHE